MSKVVSVFRCLIYLLPLIHQLNVYFHCANENRSQCFDWFKWPTENDPMHLVGELLFAVVHLTGHLRQAWTQILQIGKTRKNVPREGQIAWCVPWQIALGLPLCQSLRQLPNTRVPSCTLWWSFSLLIRQSMTVKGTCLEECLRAQLKRCQLKSMA